MPSYLEELRDIVDDWQDVVDILKLNANHFDIALNESYSVIEASDYAEEQLMTELARELKHQLRIEEMI